MDSISQYLRLVEQRPELFVPSPHIPLCLDEKVLREFAKSSDKPIGLVFDNTPYYMLINDVCIGKSGSLYSYSRVIYSNSSSNGVVVIPKCGDCFGLLSLFRHPPRMESLEFPRGFSEECSPEENAIREMEEETGLHPDELKQLGEIRADTGLTAGRVQVFLADVKEKKTVPLPDNQEAIHSVIWLTEEELQRRIAEGVITDGFTLGAYAKYLCQVSKVLK